MADTPDYNPFKLTVVLPDFSPGAAKTRMKTFHFRPFSLWIPDKADELLGVLDPRMYLPIDYIIIHKAVEFMTTYVEGAGVGVEEDEPGARAGDDDVALANQWLKARSDIMNKKLGIDISEKYESDDYQNLLRLFGILKGKSPFTTSIPNNFVREVVAVLIYKTIEYSRGITELVLKQFERAKDQSNFKDDVQFAAQLAIRYPAHMISVMPQCCPFVVVERIPQIGGGGDEGDDDGGEGGDKDDPEPSVAEVAAAIDATISESSPDQVSPGDASKPLSPPSIIQTVNSVESDAVNVLVNSQVNTQSQLQQELKVDSDTLTAEIATAITVSITEGEMLDDLSSTGTVPEDIQPPLTRQTVVVVNNTAPDNGVEESGKLDGPAGIVRQTIQPTVSTDGSKLFAGVSTDAKAISSNPATAFEGAKKSAPGALFVAVPLFDPTSIAIFKPFEKKPDPSFPSAPTYLDVDIGMPFKYVLLTQINQLLNSDKDLKKVDADINHVLALLYNQVFAFAPNSIETFPAFFGESQGQLEIKARLEYNDVYKNVSEMITTIRPGSEKNYSDLLADVCLVYREACFVYSLHVAMWNVDHDMIDVGELSLNYDVATEYKHVAFGPVEESLHSGWDERYTEAIQALQKNTPESRFEMKLLLSQRRPHKNDKPPPTPKVVVKSKPEKQPESSSKSWFPTLFTGKAKPNKKDRPYLHFDDDVDAELDAILTKLLPKKGGRPRKGKGKGQARSPGTYRLTVRRTQEAE